MTARAFALPVFSDGQVRLFAVQRADENRLVLSFPEQVDFKEKISGDDYTLVFDAAVSNPDALKVRRVLATFPQEMRQAAVSGNPLTLTLRRPKGQVVKTVRNGRRVTVIVASAVQKRTDEQNAPEIKPAARDVPEPQVSAEKTAENAVENAENISLNVINPAALAEDAEKRTEIIVPQELGIPLRIAQFPVDAHDGGGGVQTAGVSVAGL